MYHINKHAYIIFKYAVYLTKYPIFWVSLIKNPIIIFKILKVKIQANNCLNHQNPSPLTLNTTSNIYNSNNKLPPSKHQ